MILNIFWLENQSLSISFEAAEVFDDIDYAEKCIAETPKMVKSHTVGKNDTLD